jgi:polysaccharide biosynthesis/export protein
MILTVVKDRAATLSALFLCTLLLSGCGAAMNGEGAGTGASAQRRDAASESAAAFSSAESAPSEAGAVGRNYGVTAAEDAQRLEGLWIERTSHETDAQYPIEPGDVLEVNAQYVEELKSKTVRVGGDGTFYLPLVGEIRAAGLSEQALSEEIAKKLRKYVYDPEIEVFVRQYHSHQVAVIGAVKNPGLITLSDSKETVLDMLKQAGGPTGDGADALILFPRGNGNNGGQGISSGSLQPAQAAPDPTGEAALDSQPDAQKNHLDGAIVPQDLQPVIIPLDPISLTSNSISFASSESFLRMPVRPGDLILVPGGGEVMVMGWVRAPGHFRITPGLTALEVIAAAGGTLYAGDQSDVRLIRTEASGTKRTLRINMGAIKTGKAEDPPVFPNDVIDVPVSTTKLAPYVLYTLLSRTGMGLFTGGIGLGVGGGGGYY